MTTVGKILVVLHLFLSVLFMAFAGAVFTAQKNWKTEATNKTKALAAAQAKLTAETNAFERERTELTAKNDALKNDITRLTGEKAALATQVATLQSDNEKLTTANDTQTDVAGNQTREANARKTEADLQREKNRIAFETRSQMSKELQEAKDKVFALELQIQDMNERQNNTLTDMATMKRFLRVKGLPTDPKAMVALTTPPPEVEGRVMDYYKEKKGNTELVEISLGSDDGLSVGHKMTVYNGQGRYLGQIRLTNVQADKAVGIVTEKAKNTVIQKDDYVTTKL
jgi:chromosome segregation ATPase